MPNRFSGGNDYRYGFNGMEKDDEVNGITGSSYTAEYWQYDSRLGRRWNRDPITYPWQSPYATFNNNPIFYIDPSGLEGVNPKEDAKGDAGTTAPNGGTRSGEGSVSGGDALCPGCGANGEDIYGIPGIEPPNPAPVDNTYAAVNPIGIGSSGGDYGGKTIGDIFRDLDRMLSGGLHIWGSENNPSNALKHSGKGNRDTPEFDFTEFMKIIDEASSAITRMDNLKGKKSLEDVSKKINEVRDAVLQNASADEIKVKVQLLQVEIHRMDLPPLDYDTRVQFFGAQPNGVDSVYKNGILYKLQYYNGDTLINMWFEGNEAPFTSGWDFPNNSKRSYYQK